MKNLYFLILFIFGSTLLFSYQKQIPSGFHYEKDQNNRDFLVRDKPLKNVKNKPFSMKNYLEERSIKTGINLSSTSKTQDFFLINKILLPVDEEKTDDRKVEYLGILGFISIIASMILIYRGVFTDGGTVASSNLSIILFFLSLILSLIGLNKKESEYKLRGFGMIALLLVYITIVILYSILLYIITHLGE